MVLNRIIIVVSIIFVFFAANITTADVLYNAGRYVSGSLNSLTSNSSIRILNATSLIYNMLSAIEDPSKDNKKAVMHYMGIIDRELNGSINDLMNANNLNNYEFKKLDQKLQNFDYKQHFLNLGIPLNYPEMNEIISSLSTDKGKGWLSQSLKMNQNLLAISRKFTAGYIESNNPKYLWGLISGWNREIIRGSLLSAIFYE